jgi:DNA-binding transcriptional ArsR family regulator
MIGVQAEIFQALASPIRLAIVTLLYRGDLSVHEITEALGEMHIPKTSDRTNVCKNLALLRDLRIVSVRKHRQERIYSLQARCLVEAMRCTLDVIALQKKLEKGAGALMPAQEQER